MANKISWDVVGTSGGNGLISQLFGHDSCQMKLVIADTKRAYL